MQNSPMNKNRFSQIDALLDAVLDAPTLERVRILDEKCGGDNELKKEVKKLLDALTKTEDFIETPEFKPVKHFLETESDEFTGKKIGAYLLKKLLGRGGMGAVYLASRIDDFEKEVAVKIIPPFESRRASADNFRRERQILARLSHPFIAQILDGGTTGDGKPFIVMEYVDGLPLDEFCKAKHLREKETLELFQNVCQAVIFAHRNFIVHRDLKPHNILVCDDGTPKLLDFGIAKMLDAEGLNLAENKTFDGNALTLEYASPEQISGENITAASDVYSLGVILYELLTGSRPHDFKNKPLGEILNIITSEKTTAPSAISDFRFRISDSELDAIILKSLEKSPDERYRSVEDFCQDIENYLQNKPISARPQTTFYRFRKYVKRHKFETSISAVFILILFGWLTTAIFQASFSANQARENRRAAYSAEMILAANEYENANLNRLKEILEKYQTPENGAEDLRGFEWYFLNNLLNPASKLGFFTHPDEVWNAEFSPDGSLIASAANDNHARIWNFKTGAMLETAKQKGAWKVSFFPDGKQFAVASSANSFPFVKIYDTATAQEIFTLTGHTKRIRALDVSPDGKFIATGSQDGNVILWNAENGAESKRFAFAALEKITEIQDLQFSKDGAKLAVSGFEVLAILDTKSWQMKRADAEKFLDKDILLNGWKIAFSPLEKTFALGTFEGNVVFLDAETLEILRVLKLHQANIKSLAFSPDGKILATASWDRTVKFIDVQTGETVNELRGHFAGVHEVFFAPDGKTIATAGADFNVNFWNAAQVSRSSALLTTANFAVFDQQNNEFYTVNNSTESISKWSLSTRKPVWTVNGDFNVFAIDFSAQMNRVVIGERGGEISLFDATGGKLILKNKTADKSIFNIKFDADGKRIFAAYEEGLLKVFDAENLREINSLKAHNDLFKALDISPDGKLIATGGNDNFVRIFEADTGKMLFELKGNTKPLYKTIFSPDGKFLLSIGADDIARLWQTSDGKLAQAFSGMSGGIFAAAFSPDGKRLATASDVGVIRLWNIKTGEQVLAFTASPKPITQLQFTGDGKTLLSVDINGKMGFWSGN